MTWTTRQMSDRHEEDLAVLFEGRMTKGSGNQWRDQMDGKQGRESGAYVFAWDGKSTLGKSIGVTREMWAKAREQTTAWEIPILPLRWYGDERCTKVDLDLVVIEARTLADLQRDANEVIALREQVARLQEGRANPGLPAEDTYGETTTAWRGNRGRR